MTELERAMNLAAAGARWARMQDAADELDRQLAELQQRKRQAQQAAADAYVEFMQLVRETR